MFIYCIEDINDKKYIGSTKRNLEIRLTEHRYKARNQLGTSSQNLNLYNCIIYLLEECDDSEGLEREKYYIRNTDCVNIKYND
jgi:predicted GIY-YIG superfamily endonuclease